MQLGKVLIVLGLGLALVGAVLSWAPGLLSWFGRLPGDIHYEKEGVSFHFPVVTMLVVSGLLTLIMNLLLRK